MNALILLAALASTPAAGPSVDTLSQARGTQYLELRQALLQTARPKAELRVDARGWKLSLAQEALAVHAADPSWAQRTLEVPELAPKAYLKTRHGRPSATATVKTWPAALVLERLVFVPETQRHPDRDYPRHVSAEGLRQTEAQAFLHALIHQAGVSGHPAARFALTELVFDAAQTVSTRAVAAEALGRTGQVEVVDTLESLVQDQTAPLSLREAAVAGLGGLPFAQSVAQLKAQAQAGPMNLVAVHALGRVARIKGGSEALRPEVTQVLLQVLRTQPEAETQTIEALGRVGSAETAARLDEISRGAGDDAGLRHRAERAAQRIRRALGRRRGV